MSTCNGCKIQTVYNCLNRNEITENRHQKLKPNQTKSEPWQPCVLCTAQCICTVPYIINLLSALPFLAAPE